MLTQEQWLVYAYSVWPNGGWTLIWGLLVGLLALVSFIMTAAFLDNEISFEDKRILKRLWIATGIATLILQLCFLIPDKKGMAAIIATPYIVENGKSLIESLKDPNSKAFKINQLIDQSLSKAIEKLEIKE